MQEIKKVNKQWKIKSILVQVILTASALISSLGIMIKLWLWLLWIYVSVDSVHSTFKINLYSANIILKSGGTNFNLQILRLR